MKQNSGATGWSKDHPATRTDAIPKGDPECTVKVEGTTYVVFGKGAAKYVCSSLGAG